MNKIEFKCFIEYINAKFNNRDRKDVSVGEAVSALNKDANTFNTSINNILALFTEKTKQHLSKQ